MRAGLEEAERGEGVSLSPAELARWAETGERPESLWLVNTTAAPPVPLAERRDGGHVGRVLADRRSRETKVA